jgi:hypothetical protein
MRYETFLFINLKKTPNNKKPISFIQDGLFLMKFVYTYAFIYQMKTSWKKIISYR